MGENHIAVLDTYGKVYITFLFLKTCLNENFLSFGLLDSVVTDNLDMEPLMILVFRDQC